jgi:hypothetical protein
MSNVALAAAAAAGLMKPINLNNAFSTMNDTFSDTLNNSLNNSLNSTIANTFTNHQQQHQNLIQQYQQQMDNLLNRQNLFANGSNTYLSQLYNTHTMFNNNSLLSIFPNVYAKESSLLNHNLPKIDLPISFEHLFNNEIKKDLQEELSNRLVNDRTGKSNLEMHKSSGEEEESANLRMQNDCKDNIGNHNAEKSLLTKVVVESGQQLVKSFNETGEQQLEEKLNVSSICTNNEYSNQTDSNKLDELSSLNESTNEEEADQSETLKNQYLNNILAQLNEPDNKSRKRSLDDDDKSDCSENECKNIENNLGQNVIKHHTKKTKSN